MCYFLAVADRIEKKAFQIILMLRDLFRIAAFDLFLKHSAIRASFRGNESSDCFALS